MIILSLKRSNKSEFNKEMKISNLKLFILCIDLDYTYMLSEKILTKR